MKKVEHEYGGIQFAMVDGLSTKESGVGIARVGIYDINAGQILSNAEILKSNLADDLGKATVCSSGAFRIKTEQINYGGPESTPVAAVASQEAPVAKIIAEKRIAGVQTQAVAPVDVEAKVIAEKRVMPIQEAVGSTIEKN